MTQGSEQQWRNDFRLLLEREEFRRWFSYLVEDAGWCNCGGSSFDPSGSKDNRLEGMRAVGIALDDTALKVNPTAWLKAHQERNLARASAVLEAVRPSKKPQEKTE